MLYALKLTEQNLNYPIVGIGSNWFEGNPCNNHLQELSEIIKNSIQKYRDNHLPYDWC